MSEIIASTFALYAFFIGYVFAVYRSFRTRKAMLKQSFWTLIPIKITALPYLSGLVLFWFCRDNYPPAGIWVVFSLAFVMWSIGNYMNNCSNEGTRYYFYVLIGPSVYYLTGLISYYTANTLFWF